MTTTQSAYLREKFLDVLIEIEIAEPMAKAQGRSSAWLARRLRQLDGTRKTLLRMAAKQRSSQNSTDPGRLPA